MQEEGKETERSRVEGVRSVLLTRAYRTCPVGIPNTSGICGLAVLFQKFILLIQIPFSVITQSKKVYNLDPN